MTDREIKEMHELLEQQRREVAQSPEAARKLLEDLGILWMITSTPDPTNQTSLDDQ